MVEMLGVLAIIGVLTVGGIAGYSKAMTKYRISKATEQITQTIANVQTLFAQQSTYGDDYYGFDDLVIPKEARDFLRIDKVLIGEDYSGKFFGVTYGNFYQNIVDGYQYCVSLASVDWKSALGDSLVGIALSEDLTGSYDSLEQLKSYKGEFDGGYYVGAEHLPIPLNEIAEYCKKSNSHDVFAVYVGK